MVRFGDTKNKKTLIIVFCVVIALCMIVPTIFALLV